MKKIALFIIIVVILVIGASLVVGARKGQLVPIQKSQACTEEAKICPDGSAVGRTGPQCRFADCPTGESKGTNPATETKDTSVSLGQTIVIENIGITPLEVIEDSRCPAEVACIWKGTVRIDAKFEFNGKSNLTQIGLNENIIFAGKIITFVSTTPAPAQEPITNKDYRFTFSVK